MRILITGSSGTIGSEVLKQLCQNDKHQITVFDKKTSVSVRKLNPYKNKVNIVYGDIRNIKDIDKVTKNQDVVIHLAAIIPPLSGKKPKMANDVNVTGTQNLVSSLEKNSEKAFLLYSSSVSIYGDRIKNPRITTEDAVHPSEGDNYGNTKIKAEQIIRQSKLNWTIFRLSAIMGANNHKVSKIMFHMPLCTNMEITTPEDTATAFVNAIHKKEILNKQTFNLGGGEKCLITYGEFLSRSFQIFGLGKADFPEHCFAEKNFHCGFYADGEKLQNIVNFRNDNIDSYFEKVRMAVPPIQKRFASWFSKPVKSLLTMQSEPLKAYKKKDTKQMQHFFFNS
jgi:nucleoside-diphosphate-sugar epimerase